MRMKLDISIQAPEITVPLSSLSRDIVVLDLGQLTLANEFFQLDVGFATDGSTKDSSVVLYEQHYVKLTDLQIYRYVHVMCSGHQGQHCVKLTDVQVHVT